MHFLGFINLFEYLHDGHDVKASSLDKSARAAKADHACALAIEMERAILSLIGTHRRRTYSHDLVYAMHQLYSLFGKPWNAATEGSEHAHQSIKKFFAHMCCHSSSESDSLQILRHTLINSHMLHKHAQRFLPASEYVAMRANQHFRSAAKPRKKRATRPCRTHALVKGEKGREGHYKVKPLATAQVSLKAIVDGS